MNIIILVSKFLLLLFSVKCMPAVVSAVIGKMVLDVASQWIFAISTAGFIFMQWII